MNFSQQALTNVAAVVAAQQQNQTQGHPQTSQTVVAQQAAVTHHHQAAAMQTHHQAHQTVPIQSTVASVGNHSIQTHTNQSQLNAINLNVGCVPLRQNSVGSMSTAGAMMIPVQKVSYFHYFCLLKTQPQNSDTILFFSLK